MVRFLQWQLNLSKHQINKHVYQILSAPVTSLFFILSSSSRCTGRLFLIWGPSSSVVIHGWDDKAAMKKQKHDLVVQRARRDVAVGERRGGLRVVDRGLFEGCCGSWQEQNERHQNCSVSRYIHPLGLPSGLERSEGDPANNQERGVNPSHHCQWDHIRVTASLFTLLLHFPHSLFCDFYLTGGLQVGFITRLTPPHPSEL